MTFNLQLKASLEVERLDLDTGRVYKTPAGIFPSMTSVLKTVHSNPDLEIWRKSIGEEAADKYAAIMAARGTNFHSICEAYIRGEPRDKFMPDTKAAFKLVKPYLDTCLGDIYYMESPLYSAKLKVAGSPDFIGMWSNALYVGDFKTTKQENLESHNYLYGQQIAGYAIMYQEHFGDCVDKGVIIYCSNDYGVHLEYLDLGFYKEELQKTMEKYYANR